MQPKIATLQVYIHNIRQVYSVIASRIEELVVTLNETENTPEDEHHQALALKVNHFLDQLRVTIYHELEIAENIKPVNKQLLEDIHLALEQIKRLEAFVTLSRREITPQIISQIHRLSKDVENELKRHEELVNQDARAA